MVEDWSWLPDAGQPTISSTGFQALYGIYFGVLAGMFMLSADKARGGLYGISLPLTVVAGSVGFFISNSISRFDSKYQRQLWGFIAAFLSFGLVLGLGMITPLGFNYGSGELKPPVVGVGIYAIVAGLVLIRLSRRISPEPRAKDDYPTELFQVRFDNNWRMFQAYLSIAVAAFIGVLFPIGTVLVERQNLIPEPLAWFAVGLLSSLAVLVFQLQAERRHVEKAVEQAIR